MTEPIRRVLIVGTAGSGKTTVAKELSRISELPHIELDTLRYERNWREVPAGVFYSGVEAITDTEDWIIDGNYAAVRQLTWSRAQFVLWLDYPLSITLRRLVIRTLHRLGTKENSDSRNPERLIRVLGRRSIILWALRSHAPLRQEYEMTVSDYSGNTHIARHRSPAETETWLNSLEGGHGGEAGSVPGFYLL
ncbi:P-loop NTPase family protein [Streptomyces griseoaurantiacus]|jgi:adenylate kinase family enzyme|uniref:hypothetical protein n=1 Tax=Streptomyces griseoaurantiacus TaxID=68213 RepID=UPI00382633F5